MNQNNYDIIVIGGGHAGVEAAWISAKLKKRVLFITQSVDHIGYMSCNPAIGGLAKSHLVKELDILGGLMGIAADRSAIQFKMLNRSKGPAVWALRVQSDKAKYSEFVRRKIEANRYITIIQDEVIELIVSNHRCIGVTTQLRGNIFGGAVILCAGTFLNGQIHIGKNIIKSGRLGEKASNKLSDTLKDYGFEKGVLKTGTPPRISGRSIDFKSLEAQGSDEFFIPFSFRHHKKFMPQVPCFVTHTSETTHEIIRKNLHLTALYSGQIQGVGPRYCPSIEDKVNRFADKISHRLFIEPEGLSTDEYYINGFSTSLPLEIQIKALQTVKGLENAHFVRPAYAIEYDFFPAYQLKPTLETKNIANLFFAGQINGTSGYEEAAVQGLMCGINACKLISDEPPLVLRRDEAYIGILIDDLITKDIREPYRMFTSLAEYRLQLRHDNADSRLLEHAANNKLLSAAEIKHLYKRLSTISEITDSYNTTTLKKQDLNTILSAKSLPPTHEGSRLSSFLKRPDMTIDELLNNLPDSPYQQYGYYELKQAEIIIKYEGYINREKDAIERSRKNETIPLPANFDYNLLTGMRREAIEKLNRIQPINLGQASRIAGISPADITTVLINLKKMNLL